MFKSISGQAAIQTFKILAFSAMIFLAGWVIYSYAPPAVVWAWLGVFWIGYAVVSLYQVIKLKLEMKEELKEHDDNLRAGPK